MQGFHTIFLGSCFLVLAYLATEYFSIFLIRFSIFLNRSCHPFKSFILAPADAIGRTWRGPRPADSARETRLRVRHHPRPLSAIPHRTGIGVASPHRALRGKRYILFSTPGSPVAARHTSCVALFIRLFTQITVMGPPRRRTRSAHPAFTPL